MCIRDSDCADYLVKKGLPFRDAYKIIGSLVRYCEQNDKTLETLTIEEYKKTSELFENDVYDAVNLENCVKGRKPTGGPAPEAVQEQIATLEKQINRGDF